MKRKKILLSAAVAVSLLLSFTACSKQDDKAMESNNSKTEQQMENKDSKMDSDMGEMKFTANDIDGNEQSQELFKNSKITVLNIWGTFCKPCVEEMPELAKLSDEYKDKGVQVVGVVVDAVDQDFKPIDDKVEEAKNILEQVGAKYTNLLPSAELTDLYMKDLQAFPKTVLVDSEGKILSEISGSRDLEAFKKEVDDAMSKLK